MQTLRTSLVLLALLVLAPLTGLAQITAGQELAFVHANRGNTDSYELCAAADCRALTVTAHSTAADTWTFPLPAWVPTGSASVRVQAVWAKGKVTSPVATFTVLQAPAAPGAPFVPTPPVVTPPNGNGQTPPLDPVDPLPPIAGDHGYFNALVARPEHWKSYSLRDPQQLNTYKNANSIPAWVTYDPGTDREPQRQDAAKVAIPMFGGEQGGYLAADIGVSDTSVTFARSMANARAIKVGGEIIRVNAATGGTCPCTVPVTRGLLGTTTTAHASTAPVRLSTNNLPNQVRLPLMTEDGFSYLVTWDAFYTDSYTRFSLAMNAQKTYQFSSPGDSIWLEPRLSFDGGGAKPAGYDRAKGDLAVMDLRTYVAGGGPSPWVLASNQHGPGTSRGSRDVLFPVTGRNLVIKPGRWVRHWFAFDQRPNDYDDLSWWLADEQEGPVALYDRVPINIGRGSAAQRIEKFWLEFNTSTDAIVRTGEFDLVAYVRNVVVLRGPLGTDWTPLLTRPTTAPAVVVAP